MNASAAEPSRLPEAIPLPALPDAPESIVPAVGAAIEHLHRPDRLTVIVNDPQRDTPTAVVLAELARHVSPTRMRILVAAGSHTFSPERRRAFAAALTVSTGTRFADVAWHEARSATLVPIGAGGRWHGHPWLLEAWPLLAVGSVEPHYLAGFTGAHKTCTVGCAGYSDIESNHAAALRSDCRPCRLAANPVHEGLADMVAALVGARPVAAVNVVHARGRVVAAAGAADPLAALDAVTPIAQQALVCRIDRPVDVLVAEVTGALARTFYQADKGIKNSEWAVRDGGCIVLAAACPGGIGQDQFVSLLGQAGDYASALGLIKRRGYRLGDHKAVRLRHLTDPACRGVKLMLVSDGISPADALLLGMLKCPTLSAALSAVPVTGATRILSLPDAGNTCLTVEA